MKSLEYFIFFIILCVSCNRSHLNEKSIITLSNSSSSTSLLNEIPFDTAFLSDIYMLSLEGGIGILHKNSGDFVYCYICESNPHPVKDTLLSDHYAIVDSKNRKVQVYDHNFNERYVFSTDTIADGINVAGFFYEKVLFNPIAITSGFINTLTTDTILGAANCQCVHVTSTPCTPTGSDSTSPCDAGGYGSTSCSVNSENSLGGQLLGSGISVGSGSSCSATCNGAEGFYACCYY